MDWIFYKYCINQEINFIEYKFEEGNELNIVWMSIYLNLYENNIDNELKYSKEFQILSKNSWTENENIIVNP